jgi:hypothetical protein
MVNYFQLEFGRCSGQGYDNSANMKGKNKGVQARILSIYTHENVSYLVEATP